MFSILERKFRKFDSQHRQFFIHDMFYDEGLPVYEVNQNRKNKRTQSAPSGCFNILPKRPNFDNFKHRSGPKGQKYR
jgi:hypothetical protein